MGGLRRGWLAEEVTRGEGWNVLARGVHVG